MSLLISFKAPPSEAEVRNAIGLPQKELHVQKGHKNKNKVSKLQITLQVILGREISLNTENLNKKDFLQGR